MGMTATDLSRVRSWVGAQPDDAELVLRFERLGTVEAVAQEILRERRANLLLDPAKMSIDGDASWDWTKNLELLNESLGHLDAIVGSGGTVGQVQIGSLVRKGRR